MGLRSPYRRCRFWQKKIIFSDDAHFDLGGYINKKNCRIWAHRKPARIHWKPDASKMSYYLMRILVQKHNCVFENEQGEAVTVNGVVIVPCWTNFCSHKLKRRILAIFGFNRTGYVPYSRNYTRCFDPCFWNSHYQPQSWCRLATSELHFDTVDYYLWGAVEDKCYADKSETINALKDNIREAIGEIQLHTIDNKLKNWTDRVTTAWPAELAIWNKFFFIINRKNCTFKSKMKFEKIFSSFFKVFSKKEKIFGGPVI